MVLLDGGGHCAELPKKLTRRSAATTGAENEAAANSHQARAKLQEQETIVFE
jgi:hypothetical protein